MFLDTASAEMQIYILRHGIAEDRRPGSDDAGRSLTPQGKRKLDAILRAAKEADVCPGVILTSSYKRALETAVMAAGALGHEGEVIRSKALEPGGVPESVWDAIRLHKQTQELMITGHEPLLSGVIAYLLGTPSVQIDLKKGAMACVEVDHPGPRPRGILRWLITPKLAGKRGQ